MAEELPPPNTPAADLPPPDDFVADLLRSLPSPEMPSEVWARLESAFAAEGAARRSAEPGGTGEPSNVVPLRRSPRRWIPAGLVAAAAVVAAGLVLPNLNRPEPPVAGPVGVAVTPTTSGTPLASGVRAATIDALPAHYVVASGTDYSAAQVPTQVVKVLSSVGMAAPDRIVEQASLPSVPASAPALVGRHGMTADFKALHDCVAAFAGGGDKPPALMVDRATYAGQDAAIIVMIERLQTEPARASLHVIVVRPDCSDSAREQAWRTTFDVAAS